MDENKSPNEEMNTKDTGENYFDKIKGFFNMKPIEDISHQVEEMIGKASQAFDETVNGVNVENTLKLAMKAPGARIDRTSFFKDVFAAEDEEVINAAIEKNPAMAFISKEKIDEIAKSVIEEETSKVIALSAATSIVPSSFIGASVDLSQFFIFSLRVMQKLAYLYGFSEFDLNDEEHTKNLMIIFLGIMFDVKNAKQGLSLIVSTDEKMDVSNDSVMKGAMYPIMKEVIQVVSVKLAKEVFANSIVSVVPIVGALASGTITYATFNPCANRLQKALQTICLCDPASYEKQ